MFAFFLFAVSLSEASLMAELVFLIVFCSFRLFQLSEFVLTSITLCRVFKFQTDTIILVYSFYNLPLKSDKRPVRRDRMAQF